ncbi:hypothetical protein FS837_007174, partial [Tulasnella sp. UAMH 9824]
MTTRSTSPSFQRRQELSTEDEATDPKVSSTDVPVSRRTRSSHHSASTPSINNTPAGSVISSVAPSAALTRTTSQSRPKQTTAFDSATDLESLSAKRDPSPTAPIRKEGQRRLGVGRPKAIGGSGVRKSTARAKSSSVKPLSTGKIVEVVVPALQAEREEEAAAASWVSLPNEEEDDDDEGTSTPPPPPLRTKPVPGASKSDAHDTTVSPPLKEGLKKQSRRWKLRGGKSPPSLPALPGLRWKAGVGAMTWIFSIRTLRVDRRSKSYPKLLIRPSTGSTPLAMLQRKL